MELDELKAAWRETGNKLEALHLSLENLRAEIRIAHAAHSMRRTVWLIRAECLANLLALFLLGDFIADQRAIRFIVPAIALYPAFIAIFASSVAQLLLLSRIDYAAPVLDIQRRLESLRTLRLRTVQWELISALLLWVPLAIVLMQGLKGIDLYALGAGWIAANVALGVAAIPALWWAARRFGPAFNRSRLGRLLLDDLTGHGLAEARAQLAAISAFAGE